MLGPSAAQFYVWLCELRYNTNRAVSKTVVLFNVAIGAAGPQAHAHTHRTQIETCVYTTDQVNHSTEQTPLVKLTVAQLVKLLSIQGTQGFTIIFTTVCQKNVETANNGYESCRTYRSTVMMKTAGSAELYQITGRHIMEDSYHHSHRRQLQILNDSNQ